jgi:hypothetical protein
MNRAVWVSKKNQICVLIKKISDHYGGDDVEWLRAYCRDIIDQNKDDLNKLLGVCLNLEDQLKYMPRRAKYVPQGTCEGVGESPSVAKNEQEKKG